VPQTEKKMEQTKFRKVYPLLSLYHQVVDAALAREILCEFGFRVRRDGDNLNVANGEPGNGLYFKKDECPEVGGLYVDEGWYMGTLYRNTAGEIVSGMNSPWMELVDSERLLCLLTKRLCPEFVAADCDYIGNGARQRHYLSEWIRALREWATAHEVEQKTLTAIDGRSVPVSVTLG
jgi:hypothetical protein